MKGRVTLTALDETSYERRGIETKAAVHHGPTGEATRVRLQGLTDEGHTRSRNPRRALRRIEYQDLVTCVPVA